MTKSSLQYKLNKKIAKDEARWMKWNEFCPKFVEKEDHYMPLAEYFEANPRVVTTTPQMMMNL